MIVVADHATVGGQLLSLVDGMVAHGARAVLLRVRQADRATRVALVAGVRRILAPVDGMLIIAGPVDEPPDEPPPAASPSPDAVAAVHLAAAQPFPRTRPSLVGRSCHDAGEVDRAAAEGCDYVFVSPVYPTDSKPGYGPALGPLGLAALCDRAPMPVYALGGVLPERVGECLRAGAHGVAVMGPVLRDPPLVAEYLSALKEVPR